MATDAINPDASAKNETGEFAQFTNFMRRIVAVPHSKVQQKLKAEKRAKSRASRAPASDKKAH